jgi:hypothetical protein
MPPRDYWGVKCHLGIIGQSKATRASKGDPKEEPKDDPNKDPKETQKIVHTSMQVQSKI